MKRRGNIGAAMKKIRKLGCFLSFSLLSACQGEANQPTPMQNTGNASGIIGSLAAPSRPYFSLDEVDAEDLVGSMGAAWQTDVRPLENDDSLTGGRVKTLLFKRGSASLFILPNGKVWRLRINVGMGDTCARISDVKSVATIMAATFVTDVDAKSFIAQAGKEAFVKLHAKAADLVANDGCVASISATARDPQRFG